MALVDGSDMRLVPIVDGKPLKNVVGYTFTARVEEVAVLDVEILADDWVPPLGEAELRFDLGEWPQRARDALRAALDAADADER